MEYPSTKKSETWKRERKDNDPKENRRSTERMEGPRRRHFREIELEFNKE